MSHHLNQLNICCNLAYDTFQVDTWNLRHWNFKFRGIYVIGITSSVGYSMDLQSMSHRKECWSELWHIGLWIIYISNLGHGKSWARTTHVEIVGDTKWFMDFRITEVYGSQLEFSKLQMAGNVAMFGHKSFLETLEFRLSLFGRLIGARNIVLTFCWICIQRA